MFGNDTLWPIAGYDIRGEENISSFEDRLLEVKEVVGGGGGGADSAVTGGAECGPLPIGGKVWAFVGVLNPGFVTEV
jgi:hypothetical protein